MNAHVSVITLGVENVQRAKQFYAALGWPIHHEHGDWVAFAFANGTSALGIYPRAAVARDAGVPLDGHGFAGVLFSYIVQSDERVAAVLEEAEQAGGRIVRPAASAPWGGVTGCFADPDGYVWKVASGTGPQFYGETAAG